MAKVVSVFFFHHKRRLRPRELLDLRRVINIAQKKRRVINKIQVIIYENKSRMTRESMQCQAR